RGKAASRPRQLSGGQQQRVALARALVNLPAVLLLDEPLGSLDLQLRKQMQIELKQIQRQVGITFVYVTHDQEEALTMSDRIAVMNEGVLQQAGTPEEIYEQPANAFVAGFIGISNLLPGVVEDHAVRLRTGQLVPAQLDSGMRAGESVLVCVRPEKLQVGRGDGAHARVEGTVVETVYLGTATQYLVELGPDVRPSVRPLLFPGSAAIVGLGERTAPEVVDNVLGRGIPVAGVHPSGRAVRGVEVYPSIAEMPFAPEVAFVLVGHGRIEAALRDALAAGVRAFIVPGLGNEAGAAGPG